MADQELDFSGPSKKELIMIRDSLSTGDIKDPEKFGKAFAKLPRKTQIFLRDARQEQIDQQPPVEDIKAAGTLAAKGLTLDLTGAAAGAGAAAGTLYETGDYSKAKEAFFEGRGEQLAKEKKAQERLGGMGTAIEIGASIPTWVLAPGLKTLKGVRGGMTAGAVGGLTAGASQAESAEDLLRGTVLGATVGGAAGAAPLLAKKAGQTATGKAVKEVTSKALEKTKQGFRRAFIKAGEAATGIPEKDIETFIFRNKKVMSLIDDFKATDDLGQSVVDDAKLEMLDALSKKRQELNADLLERLKLSEALMPPGEFIARNNRFIELNPLLDEIRKLTLKIDVETNPELQRLVQQKIIDPLKSVIGQGLMRRGSAKVSPVQLQNLKMRFQGEADDLFRAAARGEFFLPGSMTKKQYLNIANTARKAADDLLVKYVPEVRGINQQLQKLHQLQDAAKPLLKEQSKVGRFVSLARNRKKEREVIQQLDKELGTNYMEVFEEVSAAQSFLDPGLTTRDITGKGLERTVKTASVLGGGGLLLGATNDPDLQALGTIAAIATSPLALKKAIQGGLLGSRQLGAMARATGIDAIPENAEKIADKIAQIFAAQSGDILGEPPPRPKDAIERKLNNRR